MIDADVLWAPDFGKNVSSHNHAAARSLPSAPSLHSTRSHPCSRGIYPNKPQKLLRMLCNLPETAECSYPLLCAWDALTLHIQLRSLVVHHQAECTLQSKFPTYVCSQPLCPITVSRLCTWWSPTIQMSGHLQHSAPQSKPTSMRHVCSPALCAWGHVCPSSFATLLHPIPAAPLHASPPLSAARHVSLAATC